MSFFERLMEAGRRLDRAVLAKTGLGRAVSSIREKIPPRARRWGARLGGALAIILVIGLYAAALSNSNSRDTTSRVGTGAGEDAASGNEPGASVTETTQGLDQSATGRGGSRSTREASELAEGSGGSSGSLAGKVGPGVTSSTIVLGLGYSPDRAKAAEDAGVKGAAGIDTRTVFDATVNHVNAHGGVAGRKLTPVYFTWRTGNDPHAQTAQAACTYFTEDHKIFFAFYNSSLVFADHLVACLSQRNTGAIGFTSRDEKDLARLAPYLYDPVGVNMTRKGNAYVEGLAEQGFFEPGARIGLVRFDFPGYKRATEEAIKPALAARGIKLAEEVEIPAFRSTADGSSAAQINTAVLRMRQSGVTHMMLLDADANLALVFMPSAESQAYRPRYGLTSDSFPDIMAQTMPREQLRRALGVGWSPNIDVGRDRAPSTPGRANCLEIMAKAGVNINSSSAEYLALRYCDQVLFFAKAAGEAPSLNAAGVRDVVEAFGTGFQTGSTFTTRFAPGRYDGVAATDNLFFDDGCTCFKYRGQPRSIP